MSGNRQWCEGFWIGILLVLAGWPVRGEEKRAYSTLGTIERAEPRLERLVPRDAVIEKLAEGFDWAEGPVWDRRGGFLLFSDVPRNTVFQWKGGESARVFLNPSGYTGT